MTAATSGPSGSNLFSMFSGKADEPYRTRPEAFAFSMAAQALIVGLLIYFTSCVIENRPPGVRLRFPRLDDLPLVFSGNNGGGGGGLDPLPASHGSLPRASLDPQIVPPTVFVPKEMPRLPVEETVMVAPDIKLPQGGQIGDPLSRFTTLSNGPGGPTGIGTGCCDGVGPSSGPFFGSGPPGIFPAG